MYEVERKVRMDHRTIRGRLQELGLEPVEEVVQTDTYLNHPQRDFAATDEALRIRREHPPDAPEDALVELTYKGPRLEQEAKTRIERTVSLCQGAEIQPLLEALGFVSVDVVRKRRTRYIRSDVVICLDEVAQLGEFVEIEAEIESPDLEVAEGRVDEVMAELGIDPEHTIVRPYLTLLRADDTPRPDDRKVEDR